LRQECGFISNWSKTAGPFPIIPTGIEGGFDARNQDFSRSSAFARRACLVTGQT
jgi:hypothetical protein